MKRVALITLVLLSIVVIFAGCVVDEPKEQYEIMIADEINLYEGKQTKLRPYLIDSNGNEIESRFVFLSSSDNITVTQDGEIIINNIPSEDVYVTITDRNTSTEKKVKINIVKSVLSIDGITNANNKLINGLQSVILGEEYIINVKTQLADFNAEDYCTIKIVDNGGKEIKTFNIGYNKNAISLKAVGLGKSTADITFKNKDGKTIYNSKVDFEIVSNDKELSNSILALEKKDAISVDELESIQLVALSEAVKDISQLSFLKSLNTVVFTTEHLMECNGISSKYTYRIKKNLLNDYMENESWRPLFENIIPYEDDYNQMYVVYRSEKGENLSCAPINADLKLRTLVFSGYTNTGWTDSQGDLLTEESIIKIEKNGIHVFAVWKANENKLIFMSNTDSNETASISATTDSVVTMPECTFRKAGYTFVGWSNVQDGEANYLTSSKYMVKASDEVFYAIWEANENTLLFDANTGNGTMESIKVKTDEIISLPKSTFKREGYTFMGWSKTANNEADYSDEGSFKMGSDEEITLYAVWSANENNLILKSTITEDIISVKKRTDEIFNLPLNTFVRPGYTFVGWSTIDNGEIEYKDGDTFEMSSNENVTLYAIWAPNLNTIVFDSNNDKNETSTQTAYTDTTVALNKNIFVNKNYEFLGWSTTKDGNVEYTDLSNYDMGTSQEYILYAVWQEYEIYEIVYVLNNGEQNPNNITEYRFDSDDVVFYPPTRKGYQFVCWCSDEQLTTEIKSIPTGSTGEVYVFAKWQANLNTLKFDANGGEGVMEPEKIYTDSVIILKDVSFTKHGYSFVGWKISPDSQGIAYYSGHEYVMGADSEYTLYAEWSLDTYTVNYELNQGKIDTTNPVSYNVHSETIVLKEPTRSGYTFKGWYTDSNFTNKIESIKTGSTGNLNLYAKWSANANTLRFDANGGKGTMTSITVNTDEVISLPLNVFTRSGYTFIGWKSVPDENIGAEYQNGSMYVMGERNEYTLYAVWSKNTYRITYELDGGINDTLNPSTYTVTNEIVLQNPIRNGYKFEYWVDANNEKLENNTISKGTTGDIVLFAKWSANVVTLFYDANGGVGSMNSVSHPVGFTFNLSPVTFTNGTLKFVGWSTTMNGASTHSNEALYTMGTSDITLYAVWANTDHIIQWVLNGGQNNPNNPNGYSSSDGTTEFHAPSRVGYTFDGWYLDESYKTSITKITAGSTDDYTIYAKWTANKYTVHFDYNGADVVKDSDIYTYDQSYGTLPNPTRNGYDFLGWYYNDSTQITTTSKMLITSEHTLEAKWRAKTYQISFNANGGVGDTSAKNIMFSDGVTEAYSTYGTLPTVARSGYTFNGWYYGDTRIYENTIMTVAGNHILEARWSPNSYVVYFDANGGSVSPSSNQILYRDKYDSAYPSTFGTLPTPKRTGYTFNGWYNEDDGTRVEEGTIISSPKSYKLKASWSINKYTVIITTDGERGGYITDDNGTKVASGTSYDYGTPVTFHVKYDGDENNWWKIDNQSIQASQITMIITNNISIHIHSDQSCIASGTMITLADGTQKKIEDINDDDLLLVFNHETGNYESAPILFIERDGWKEYTIINLEFSNGNKTRIIHEHALFDVTLNKYVYIDGSNYYQYVGHEFVIIDSEMNRTTVKLEKSYKTREHVGCYSLITAYHSNYFIDGLLSIPGGMDGIFNYFEYGENLAYDSEKMTEDIKKYGLYTYEDFADYVPYEVFEYMFPAKYYKIAVGKGLITFEEIIELVDYYLVSHGYV